MDITEDVWLSGICDQPVFRVSHVEADPSSDKLASHVVSGKAFYYAKVDTADVLAVRALCRAGFFVTDVNVTFAAPPSAIHGATTSDVDVGPMVPADKERVLDIAHDSFRYTRFHLDPLVPKAVADRVKREWVRNYADGKRGDALLVATASTKPLGFLAALKVDASSTAIIDLVGVSTDAQRRGVGRAMLLAFAARYRDMKELVVGTQVANTPSVRMYETLGFRLKSSQYVLHRHTDAGRPL